MIRNNINNLCTVVIPTFFPDKKIFDNLRSLPENIAILIIDNSYNDNLKIKLKNFKNCQYFNIGDVGLGKTFNFALKKIKTPYVLLTQPDVVLRENCIENLIEGFVKYPDAGMVAPIVYDNGFYSDFDHYDLRYSKGKKEFFYKKIKKIQKKLPDGDFCVDAVNATTMLIKVKALKQIGGWDNNIYVYLEDIDICLRLYLRGYSIVKIKEAIVDHKGWASHFDSIKDTMNISRIWHFTWSSLYFENKFTNQSKIIKKIFSIILFSLIKLILNLLILRINKSKVNFIKLSACHAFIFNKGSYFRAKHKVLK